MAKNNSASKFFFLHILAFLCGCTYAANSVFNETFQENLVIRPCSADHPHCFVLHFQLSTSVLLTNAFDYQSGQQQHFNIFPSVIYDIIKKSEVDSMKLGITQSRWLYNSWGYPPLAAPVGAELLVNFVAHDNFTSNDIDAKWKSLRHSLSGLLCASFNLMDEKTTVALSQTERYGVIPRESACTENLTPLLKMIPCHSNAGVSSLLNPLKVHAYQYNSMGILFEHHESSLRLTQTHTVVVDTTLWENPGVLDFGKAFGKITGMTRCPIATTSLVAVEDVAGVEISVTPEPSEFVGNFAISKLSDVPTSFVISTYPGDAAAYAGVRSMPIQAHQYLVGYSDKNGGCILNVENLHPTRALTVSALQILPFFTLPFFSSMRLKVNSNLVAPESVFSRMRIEPGMSSTPSTLQWETTIPALTTISVEIPFDKDFMHHSLHHPDAHRGWDIPSAVITALYSDLNSLTPVELEWSTHRIPFESSAARIYTEVLGVTLPLPDFSMPYNVMTLTGTALALFFGSMFTLMVRRWKNVLVATEFVSDRPIAKLYRLVCRILRWIKSKFSR